MNTPPFLRSGDRVGIVAPARKVTPEELEPAVSRLVSWGLEAVEGQHLYGDCNQYSGTDDERLADLQMMLDDPSIKAVFAARGGYGTVRIIDKVDFTSFCRNPKWVVGFSDITVLHSHIHALFSIETLHATMPLTFPANNVQNESIGSLKKALFGETLLYNLSNTKFCRRGAANGILVGGNLSLLYGLSGTASDIDTRGKILFIEDLDEYLYHIDRMMMNLRRSGKLEGLAGLIVGGMEKMNDNTIPFGKTAGEIIFDAVSGYDYPVYSGFPAGHLDDNRALILGREVNLNVMQTDTSLRFLEPPLA